MIYCNLTYKILLLLMLYVLDNSYSFSTETVRKFDIISLYIDIQNSDTSKSVCISSIELEGLNEAFVLRGGGGRRDLFATLGPHSSYRYTFVPKVAGRFPYKEPRPEIYRISCKISYTIDGKFGQDKANIDIPIHSALISIIV